MSLAEVSEFIKKAVKILGLIVAAYLVALILKAPIKSAYLALFPPKNTPTVAFGLLQPLEFTQIDVPQSNPEFILNTTNGRLPNDIETVARIYRFERPGVSYSAGEKAQEYARILGFSDSMRVSDLSAEVFEWEDIVFGGVLEVSLDTRNLRLNTPLGGKGSYFPTGNLSKTNAIQIAKNLLINLDKYSGTLYEQALPTEINVDFGKFRSGSLVEADSILEAQIAKVDFFRKIDETPVLGPNPKEGMLQVYVRIPQEENPQLNFPVLQAFQWKIDTDSFATYPLTPISQVWEQVQQNNGIISNVTPANANPFAQPTINSSLDKIYINEIFLAYFDSKSPQTYAQPIYVFEGNYTAQNGQSGEITIYYPAISREYINLNN